MLLLMNAGGARLLQSEIASEGQRRVGFRVMKMPQLRSPHDKVGGLCHFGRMVYKIRANAAEPLGESGDRSDRPLICSREVGAELPRARGRRLKQDE